MMTSIPRWEYLTLESSTNYGKTKFHVNGELQSALTNNQLSVIINQLGGQGWELVGLTSADSTATTYIFKRPRNGTGPLNKQEQRVQIEA